jgi:hypothetical protein
VITGYIIPSFRPNNRLLLKSISPRLAWDMIKKIV